MNSAEHSENNDKSALLTTLVESIKDVCNESDINFSGYKNLVKETIIEIVSIQKNGRIQGLPIQTSIDSKIELLVSEVNNKIKELG